MRHSIERVLSSGDQIDGYELLRVVNFLGRWWRSGGWYPEYRLRLVRRTKASWGGTDPHEHAIVNGPVARLSGELYHYTYDDFRDQLITTNKVSSISATQLYRSGKRFHVHQLLINPVARFVKFYFLRKGHREGLAGLVVAVIEAAGVFLKYAKLWELEHSSSADLTRPKAHPATEAREPSSRQDNAVAQD